MKPEKVTTTESMTPITEKTIKLGTLQWMMASGIVYQDGANFFHQAGGWTINDNEEECHVEWESRHFASLEELLAASPSAHFQPEGTVETKEEFYARHLKAAREAREALERQESEKRLKNGNEA